MHKTETTHTPGPWTWERARASLTFGTVPSDKHRYAIGTPLGELFSGVELGISSEEADANARLIAAAPDLLEAAKEALAEFISNGHAAADGWPCNSTGCAVCDAGKTLRAAIRKAEGE